MELYVTQLIDDLKAGHNITDPDEILPEETLEDIVQEAVDMADDDNYIEISKIIGFYVEQFPPIDKLNDKQIERLNLAITDLFLSFYIDPDFPEKLDEKIKYELLKWSMKSHIFTTKYENTIIDFCDYSAEDCPFGEEYCQCKQQLDFDNRSGNQNRELPDDFELPF
jgi:hypothetical protein